MSPVPLTQNRSAAAARPMFVRNDWPVVAEGIVGMPLAFIRNSTQWNPAVCDPS